MIKSKKDDTEQRAIIAILLSLAIYWVWTAFFMPPPPASTAAPVASDGPAAIADAPVRDTPVADTPAVPTADIPEREVGFSTSEISATLSSEGGGLRTVQLPSHPAAYTVTPIWNHVYNLVTGDGPKEWKPYGEDPGTQEVLSENGLLIAAGSGRFVEGRYTLDSRGAVRVTDDGLRITKTYTEGEGPNFVDVSVTFENIGSRAWTGPLWVGMADIFEGEAGRYENATRPNAVVDGDLETQNDIEDLSEGAEIFEGPVSWFGVGDRYFMASAIPDSESWGRATFASTGVEGGAGAYLVRDQTLEPGRSETLNMRVFVGPKDLSLLREIGHDFDQAVDFGIFGFFSNILLWILEMFHGLVGNWGVAIILLTVSVKAAFWPLTQKSFKSSRAMQAVQPKIAALKEKYGDEPQKLGEEQMKLFREEGVNPLAGCLPMVVQMPVWFALYSVLLSSADVYNEEFLYLKDLSSADPLGVLPLMVGVFYFIQQRIMPTSPNMDPMQQKLMRMMPMFFVVFMFAFPSGLNIYILINTLLSITQMWLINRAYPVAQTS